MEMDAFIKIDGIDGESTVKGFEKAIKISSMNFGVSNQPDRQVSKGGNRGQSPSFSDMSFTKRDDTSTPALMQAVGTGKNIPKAVVSIRKAVGENQWQVYYTVTLENCVISSFQTGGEHESFSINFASIKIGYKPQQDENTLGAEIAKGYNIATAEAF